MAYDKDSLESQLGRMEAKQDALKESLEAFRTESQMTHRAMWGEITTVKNEMAFQKGRIYGGIAVAVLLSTLAASLFAGWLTPTQKPEKAPNSNRTSAP